MKRRIALALAVVVTELTACRESPSGLIADTGNVYQLGGDCGGTWLAHADAGREYELTNLAAEFQQTGLRVRFTLRPRTDVVSGCMVGASADVVAMRKL